MLPHGRDEKLRLQGLVQGSGRLGPGLVPWPAGNRPQGRARPCLCGQEGVLSLQLSGHHEAGASDGNVAPLALLSQLPFPALSPVLGQKGQSLCRPSAQLQPACLPWLPPSCGPGLAGTAGLSSPGKALFPLLSPWKWSLSCDPVQSSLLLCTAGSQGQLHGKMTA